MRSCDDVMQHTAQQHNNNNSSISEGYGMSQKKQNECTQATFDSYALSCAIAAIAIAILWYCSKT